MMINLLVYATKEGREPFVEWLDALSNKFLEAHIGIRLHRVSLGNFGDYKSVGEGVIELRIHIGSGYRIYCGKHGKNLIVLLAGGDKSHQATDIKKAKACWIDWKKR